MKVLFALATIGASLAAIPAQAADLQIRISGIRQAGGSVLVDLHNDPSAFPRDASRAFQRARVRVTGSTVTHTFKNVPPGTYAYTYLVDENGNGKLDTNAFGVPTEGIGFSMNPSFSLSAPSFSDAAFSVQGRSSTAPSTVKYY
jgi:uncharacterized protein (DUF2141 family)